MKKMLYFVVVSALAVPFVANCANVADAQQKLNDLSELIKLNSRSLNDLYMAAGKNSYVSGHHTLIGDINFKILGKIENLKNDLATNRTDAARNELANLEELVKLSSRSFDDLYLAAGKNQYVASHHILHQEYILRALGIIKQLQKDLGS